MQLRCLRKIYSNFSRMPFQACSYSPTENCCMLPMNHIVHFNVDLIEIAIYYMIYLDIYYSANSHKEKK